MAIFLVESPLPALTPGLAKIIPEHRAVVNELFQEGLLVMYTVSADRSKWWCAVQAENEFEVIEVLERMPLFPFLKPFIHDLMFFNGADQFIPRISLN